MLFNEIVYGPIHSRRLGISLGMNVMPRYVKQCTFDCIYCECGFNPTEALRPHIPTLAEIEQELEIKLQDLQQQQVVPDVITFSGNGEPTLHPQFLDIIRLTCRLRDKYCPSAKVSVLSNSTQLSRADIREALMLADNRILKLDSAITETMRVIDQPVNKRLTSKQIIDSLMEFHGDFTLQTCFLRGSVNGTLVDNTTADELKAWYEAVNTLQPKQIMIYVIDRATPVPTLEKIEPETMHAIADKLRDDGYDVIVSC